MRRVLSALAALLIGGAIFVAAGELVLRAAGFSAPIWYEPHPQLGWSMRPGAEGWFTTEGRAYVKVNSAGFRDREHSPDKPAGSYRIAVLGDSAVEALQLDMKSTFWWRLQEELASCPALRGREVEVMAFGVSGYGTAQQYLLLQSTALRYQPDLVLLAFANGNDLPNNSPKLESWKERPFFLAEGDGLRLDASFREGAAFVRRSSRLYEAYRSASDRLRLVQLVQAARHGLASWGDAGNAHASGAEGGAARKRMQGVEPTTDISVFAPPRDAAWEQAWIVTERLVSRMHELTRRHNARFALTMITNSTQLYPDPALRKRAQDALGVPDLFYIERRMEALGKREGFLVVPVGPELQKRADADGTYFHGFPNLRMGWGHWNEKGHATAAAILAPRLCEEASRP